MSLKILDATTGELVPAPRNLPTELFLDFDRRDEAQIEAELLGGVVEEYAYRFDQGGQTVTGLSLAGVMAVAQNMGGITCATPRWEITEDEYYCEIAATDHKNGMTVWGNASQPKHLRRRDGSGPLDPHARAKCLSKAQRNAIRKLIPETMATKMLVAYLAGQQPQQRRPIAGPRSARSAIEPEPEPFADDAPVEPDMTIEEQLRRDVASVIAHADNALNMQHVRQVYKRAQTLGLLGDPTVAAAIERARQALEEPAQGEQAQQALDVK